MSNPPELPAAPDETRVLLQDYLDHLCAPLVGVLPFAERQAVREEIGHHLRALAAAREELGATPAEAMAQALRQFGRPRAISHGIRRERTAPLRRQPRRLAAAAALGALVTGVVMAGVDLLTGHGLVQVAQAPSEAGMMALGFLVTSLLNAPMGGLLGLLAVRCDLTTGKALTLGGLLVALGWAALVVGPDAWNGHPLWRESTIIQIAISQFIVWKGMVGLVCGGITKALIDRHVPALGVPLPAGSGGAVSEMPGGQVELLVQSQRDG
jgi:hypothetical protein